MVRRELEIAHLTCARKLCFQFKGSTSERKSCIVQFDLTGDERPRDVYRRSPESRRLTRKSLDNTTGHNSRSLEPDNMEVPVPKILKPLRGKTTKPKTTFVSQTEAKNKFLAFCRHVISTGEFVCVQDQTGEAFLTLTTRAIKGPFVTISAQLFKDHFARCSSLIRDGVAFELTLRNSNQTVFARRHTAYRDPLDHVIEQWRERITDSALTDGGPIAQLARDFSDFASKQGRRQELQAEEERVRFEKLVKGISRLVIGHRPFEEGQAPDQRYADLRNGAGAH